MIKIERWYRDDCTLGILSIDGFQCFSLELADHQNEPYISCIPEGVYKYKYRDSPNHGHCLELQNVPNRTYIQIHVANFTKQIQGCIAVGNSIKFLDGDDIPDVTNSAATLVKIMELAGSSGTIQIL